MNGWGATDRGRVRAENQDCYLIDVVSDRDVSLSVVCDGMGGAKAGNIASSLAAEAFMDDMKRGFAELRSVSEIPGLMRRCVDYANSMVYKVSLSESAYAGMGTTIVGAVTVGDYAAVVNVGDSRAYISGASGIKQITKDHSVVEEMIDRGDLTREEASLHPDKNLITRALGVEPGVDSDVFEINFEKGSCLILCTDGVANCVTAGDMRRIINRNDRSGCAGELIALAMENGSTDNVTAVILEKEVKLPEVTNGKRR